jgi:hypothetical protein
VFGDKVVLLDGLTYPVVARECGNERFLIVGCANVMGVNLGHTVEEAGGADGSCDGVCVSLLGVAGCVEFREIFARIYFARSLSPASSLQPPPAVSRKKRRKLKLLA